jgi:hypothetical protein
VLRGGRGDALEADGTATCPTAGPAVGSHTLTAIYSGTEDYDANVDTEVQVVDKAAILVTLVSSNNPAAYGLPVTFTATVTAPSRLARVRSRSPRRDGAAVARDVDPTNGQPHHEQPDGRHAHRG